MTELGDKLKAARREKGLSLDDLQQLTKIQKRYLVAIEEGNYSVMPGKFYVRAFIKQYAEAVDLDSATLFDEFENEVPESQQEVVKQEQSRAQKKSAPLTTQSVGGTGGSNRNRFFDILPKVLIALFIVFILFIIWYFVFANNNNDDTVNNSSSDSSIKIEDGTNSSTTKKSSDSSKNDSTSSDDSAKKAEEQKAAEQKKKEEEKKVEVTKGETSGNATTYTVKNADQLSLEISASGGDSWIGVSAESGSSIYNKTLTDGESSGTIDGGSETTISVVIGNAPVTTVKVNGVQIEMAPTLVKQVLTISLDSSGNSDSSDSSAQ
ncbi:helix-turn-helix domain-containing protein [Listeria ilorinensis]|uniref:helix-turn-helix domain-containing protein n=1 Tax=Listeria ilorinensis TaxID=2867439 RepID=UPI001EF6F587|nr:RodZ domain-containing protein [Listeria ilorinensis]